LGNSECEFLHLTGNALPSPRKAPGWGFLKLTAVAAKSREPGNTRLVLGDYLADILLDARQSARIFHWIVQRVGSAAIVHWGQEYSFEEAEIAAETCLRNLASNRQKPA